MSNIVIAGDTSGSVTLQAQAVSGSTTLTLPTTNGTLVTTASGQTLTSPVLTNPSISSGGLTFSDSSTQTAAASPYVLKNRIINGDCRIDQRNAGASVSISTGVQTYVVDRFSVYPLGSGCTAQRVAGISGFQYALKVTGAASNTQIQIMQKIESLNTYDLINQTITISFYAQASSSKTSSIYFVYPNAVDNYSGYTQINATTFNVTTSSQRFSFTFNAGANAGNGLAIIIADAAYGAGETLTVTGFQLEIGSTATPFERRLYNQELANCQRYACSNFPTGNAWVQNSGATNSMEIIGAVTNQLQTLNFTFPVTMRASPTITTYSPNAASANWGTNATTPVASIGANNQVMAGIRAGTGVTAGYSFQIFVSATAEL